MCLNVILKVSINAIIQRGIIKTNIYVSLLYEYIYSVHKCNYLNLLQRVLHEDNINV